MVSAARTRVNVTRDTARGVITSRVSASANTDGKVKKNILMTADDFWKLVLKPFRSFVNKSA